MAVLFPVLLGWEIQKLYKFSSKILSNTLNKDCVVFCN